MQDPEPPGSLLPKPIEKIWKYSSRCGNEAGLAPATGVAGPIRFVTGNAVGQLPGDGSAEGQPLQVPFMSPKLFQLKDELNATKSSLSCYDIGKWSAHTARTQPAAGVVSYVSGTYNAELSTNAWCKMYEIVANFRLVEELTGRICPAADGVVEAVAAGDAHTTAPERQQQQPWQQHALCSVHLCEAPGAFVCALNHSLKTEDIKCEHRWLASTLNPWYEGNKLNSMIGDDRFILHTQEHWCFGRDQSGDILDLDNLQHIVSEAALLGPVMLVTADGSFDCQDEPAEQERLVYPLLAAEVYAALLMLAEGGAFVLKTFTAFETETTVLVYLLTVAFEEVMVFKPMTSKPGNSELYTICRGYRGAAAWMAGSGENTIVADAFKVAIQQRVPVLDPLCLPDSFVAQHIACCQAFKLWQEETILSNVRLYHMPWSMWREVAREQQRDFCAQFAELCRLKPIRDDLKITGSLLNRNKERPRAGPAACSAGGVPGSRKRLVGSLEERSQQARMPWREYVGFIGFYDVPPATSAGPRWISASPSRELDWSMVSGKSLECVGSSRFCDHELVEELQRFLQNAAELPISLTSSSCGCGLRDKVVQQLTSDVTVRANGKTVTVAILAGSPADAAVAQDLVPGEHSLLRIESAYDWLELQHRRHLLNDVLSVFRYVRRLTVPGSTCSCDDGDGGSGTHWHTVVLPLSTVLTRFSVNCLYVLWNYFDEMSFVFAEDSYESAERPPGPLVHLCCRGRVVSTCSFCCPLPLAATIEKHLLSVSAACDSAAAAAAAGTTGRRAVEVLEFIPIKTIIEDEKFMKIVQATNRVAVKKLVNWLLAREQLALQAAAADRGAPDD